MNLDDLGLNAGDIIDAMEGVGLRYPYNPTQTLAWHRPDVIFDNVAPGKPVIVHGSRTTRTGRVPDVRLGHMSETPNRLVVSRAGDFIPERFAFWATPPAFEGEAPLIVEARKEGWL